MQDPLKVYKDINPKFFEELQAARADVFTDSALPAKTKYLIALALDAAANAPEGVTALGHAALKNGATPAEIVDTVRIAHYICGVGAVYTAARGLQEVL